jgi:hypothetical protein
LANITFVLLNPSTADADQLDPTLRRCVTFAKREGFGGMVILNLYAFRTEHPKVMLAASEPVGPDNDRILASATGTIVAGWGANAAPARVAEALASSIGRMSRARGSLRDGERIPRAHLDGLDAGSAQQSVYALAAGRHDRAVVVDLGYDEPGTVRRPPEIGELRPGRGAERMRRLLDRTFEQAHDAAV